MINKIPSVLINRRFFVCELAVPYEAIVYSNKKLVLESLHCNFHLLEHIKFF